MWHERCMYPRTCARCPHQGYDHDILVFGDGPKPCEFPGCGCGDYARPDSMEAYLDA